MTEVDYLIVGQGVAGTLIAHKLCEKNVNYHIIDPNFSSAASLVATGIINPYTGRRLAKSWRIDEFLPQAIHTYNSLSSCYNTNLISKLPINRFFTDYREQNDLLSRIEDISSSEIADISSSYSFLNGSTFGGITIQNAYLIKLASLIQHFRKNEIKKGNITNSKVDWSHVTRTDDGWLVGNFKTRHLICCGGYQDAQNPYWSYLPFQLAKGEALVIMNLDLPETEAFTKGHTLSPMGNHFYKWGSTYAWHDNSPLPTTEKRNELEEKLKQFLKSPYEVISHVAGIRPAAKNRRPFIGQHPKESGLYILNGLGSKAALLAPFLANNLVDHLLNNEPLDPECDISRFNS